MSQQRIGIIDIGSNSIRLVIYEETETKAHRVIDESKESARLSERIDPNGHLHDDDIMRIVAILNHFKMLCHANRTRKIRAVATAAIRNAANSRDIIAKLRKHTGLAIEILSGEEEARLGFLGMINAIDIADGILVDIGGGSTEVTLFRQRAITHSVSFPFGSVNTTKRYTDGGNVAAADIRAIEAMVENALRDIPWLRGVSGLPLVGLGGTNRSMCKLDQRMRKYSLPLTHNYELEGSAIAIHLQEMMDLPVDQRKKIEGVSKDRADIIVPGIAILYTIYRYTNASRCVISGAGLRDGLYYETMFTDKPKVDGVLAHSVRNLLALHPSVPIRHVEQVNRLALALFDSLQSEHQLDSRARAYIDVASLLYRIGVTVHYYDYPKHTFYLMAHSRIDGLSHREIILCAMIASYKNKNRVRQTFQQHRDIIGEADCQLAIRLGTLLHLAIALDRSETQPVERVEAAAREGKLELALSCRHEPSIELRQVKTIENDFKKVWGLSLRCRA